MPGTQILAGWVGHLGRRRGEIADRWREALSSVGVVPFQSAGDAIVAGWVDQLIELVFADLPDHTLAGGLGATLADFCQARPEALGLTQEVLASELIAGLPPQEAVMMQQRVIPLLAALAVGFVRRTKARIDARYRQAEAVTEAKMAETELLRRETHHRIRNNLTALISLLQLQSEQSKDSSVREALQEGITRIRTMACIHEQLYRVGKAEQVDMHSYIHDLLFQLGDVYGYDQREIRMQVQADGIMLDADLATSLGLIVNELVSNALKYAFEGHRAAAANEISVFLRREGMLLALQVRDNGKGLPETLDLDRPGSFGLTLVNLLVRQINGEFRVLERRAGAAFEIIVPRVHFTWEANVDRARL